jgi:methylated-DNA-protein-cysteine methyltransferase-like protein
MPHETRVQVSRRHGTSASRAALSDELSEYASYYAVVRKIPRGRVLTYGDVARLAGRPTSARRVGYALFAVRDAKVPWWRVVNARGEISLRHHSGPGGPEDEQRYLLLKEGVEFSADGRIDLEAYRHHPRSPAQRATRHPIGVRMRGSAKQP